MLRLSGGCRDFLFDLSAEDGKSRALVERSGRQPARDGATTTDFDTRQRSEDFVVIGIPLHRK